MIDDAPHLLRLQQQRARAWKNGMGVSWVIAAEPEGSATAASDWEFSRAAIIRDAPLDIHPGQSGWLTLIQGEGGALCFSDGRAVMLRQPFMPLAYDCDPGLHWKPASGASTVLHLRFREDRIRVDLAVLAATAEAPAEPGDSLIAHRRVIVRLDQTRMLRLSLWARG